MPWEGCGKMIHLFYENYINGTPRSCPLRASGYIILCCFMMEGRTT